MANDLVPYSQALQDPATTAANLETSDVIAIAREDANRPTGFKSMVTRLLTLAKKIVSGIDYSTELTETTAKTITGAINEVAQNSGSVDITTEIDTPASIQTFNDGGNNIPLKSLVTNIVPVQAGSGDPSPSNPRAISGHSNCIVTVSDGDSISRTTTLSLGSTVYGGSLECVEGEGQITYGYIEFDGSSDEDWIAQSSANGFRIDTGITFGNYQYGLCNFAKVLESSSSVGGDVSIRLGVGGSYTDRIIIFNITNTITGVTDVTSWKTYLSTHPLQVVYPLGTPTSLTVTGANIPTLSGENNIYTDCGDIQSLEYFNENGNDIDSLVNLETRLSGRIRTKTYTGDGSVPLVVTFDEVPTMILNIFGNGQGSQVIAFPFIYGLTSFGGVYVTPNPWTPPTQAGGNHLLYKVAYSNGGKTMTVRASAGDAGAQFNQNGDTYTIYYLV